MTKKKVWRYTCGFCRKSGCSGGHIARHERHCTKNPDRVCRMCAAVGDKQVPVVELVEAIDYVSAGSHTDLTRQEISRLRTLANNCPACILAAIRQARDLGEAACFGVEFHFKGEAKNWIEDYRSAMFRDDYGDGKFDREEWLAARVKRFSCEPVKQN